jgi:hypothetical protein
MCKSVLKSFKGKELKIREEPATVPVAEFLRWLHMFVLRGIEPGYSFQKNLSTLQLYQALLQAFSPAEKNLQVFYKI